ncbi:MAG: hypothetical protein EBR82_24220 [Caulobacteraceae bacterium]|nr:hypothetical protein [Caulobacteraceae bacterium]
MWNLTFFLSIPVILFGLWQAVCVADIAIFGVSKEYVGVPMPTYETMVGTLCLGFGMAILARIFIVFGS